jgi:hypothetical protein
MSKKEEVQEQQGANAIVITIQLAEAVVGYLKTKPMIEVEAFVNAIAQSPGVVINQEASEEPKK